jgi:phosphatidylglycerol:prolipoprotein diacylglycerol transferase
LAISVLVALWISIKRAPRYGVEQKSVLDIALVIMISAVIGSRFWYVIHHVNEFQGHWFDTINPFQNGYIGIAGLSMVGGIVLAILTSLVYALAKNISFVNMGDTIAPSFLLGAGIK